MLVQFELSFDYLLGLTMNLHLLEKNCTHAQLTTGEHHP